MPFSGESVCFSSNASCDFHCMWKITKFSSFSCAVGERIDSQYFQPQENAPEFFLSIFPGGDNHDNKGFIGCYLYRSTNTYAQNPNEKNIFLKYSSISLRNSTDEVLYQYKDVDWHVFKRGQGWGFSKTIKRDELINDLIDDVVIFCINATYCSTCLKDRTDKTYFVETSPKENLIKNYQLLLTNQEISDTVFLIGEEKIPVHSLILSAHSKVFAAMFQKNMKEKNTETVEISDFEKNIMDSMIEFIYTGNIKMMTFDIVMELIRAADKYQLESLKLYCSNYLISHLVDENVAEVLMNADTYNATKLRDAAIGYFRRCNGGEILKKYRPELKKHPEVLLDILEAIAQAGK